MEEVGQSLRGNPLMSLNQYGAVLYDHSLKLVNMKPEGILEEFLFLSSDQAQEKDRKGVAIGLSNAKHERLEKIKAYLLASINQMRESPKKAFTGRSISITKM